ncbi:hypothetical protein GCM10028805_27260 [Spirosoma harenae]
MPNIEIKKLNKVKMHFNKWIELLSFPERLHQYFDFDAFYQEYKGEDSGPPTYEQRKFFWKYKSDDLKSIRIATSDRRLEYNREIPELIEEVETNSINAPNVDASRQEYLLRLDNFYKEMSKQVNKFDRRWKNRKHKFGASGYKDMINSLDIVDHTYQIDGELQEIGMAIPGIIYDLKVYLKQLANLTSRVFDYELGSTIPLSNEDSEPATLFSSKKSESIIPPSNKESSLTKRQKILKYFYTGGDMLKRSQPEYNDYLPFCTPAKRISYPNGSKSKTKYLIKDIEKVQPFLTEIQRQQADSEIGTLRKKLLVEN